MNASGLAPESGSGFQGRPAASADDTRARMPPGDHEGEHAEDHEGDGLDDADANDEPVSMLRRSREAMLIKQEIAPVVLQSPYEHSSHGYCDGRRSAPA